MRNDMVLKKKAFHCEVIQKFYCTLFLENLINDHLVNNHLVNVEIKKILIETAALECFKSYCVAKKRRMWTAEELVC